MFADGELVLDMSYGPFSVASGIEEGIYTDTTQTFVFDNGTIGNTNYMGIAFNSPNKGRAMVVNQRHLKRRDPAHPVCPAKGAACGGSG